MKHKLIPYNNNKFLRFAITGRVSLLWVLEPVVYRFAIHQISVTTKLDSGINQEVII